MYQFDKINNEILVKHLVALAAICTDEQLLEILTIGRCGSNSGSGYPFVTDFAHTSFQKYPEFVMYLIRNDLNKPELADRLKMCLVFQ